jgi:hypothetical protein
MNSILFLLSPDIASFVSLHPLERLRIFFNTFTRYDLPVLDLARDLIDWYGDEAVMLQYFQNEIFSESLDDMVQIGLFLLLDRRFSDRAGEIAAYFRRHQDESGGYYIKQDEILLIIRNCTDRNDTPDGHAGHPDHQDDEKLTTALRAGIAQ